MTVQNSIDAGYEKFTSSGNTFSGPFSSPESGEYTLIAIGPIVAILLPQISNSSANNLLITLSVAVPSNFRPDNTYADIYLRVLDNTVPVAGNLQVDSSTGVITIGVGAVGNPFSATGDAGIFYSPGVWIR